MKGKAERRLTPFVGRDRELQSLFECFEKARAGHGQVVFVVGEPGIGKSRLLLEFRRHLGEDATWLEGRSIAFYPLIDMLRRNFRVEEGDTEGTIATKIERGVIRLGEDPGDPVVLSMDPRNAGARPSTPSSASPSGPPRCDHKWWREPHRPGDRGTLFGPVGRAVRGPRLPLLER
jgi:hypothetical protein